MSMTPATLRATIAVLSARIEHAKRGEFSHRTAIQISTEMAQAIVEFLKSAEAQAMTKQIGAA